MVQVMGTPFDRVQCPTPTRGTGNVVVTNPNPRFMRPWDAGVRDGTPVTLLIEEGNNFELVESTAQNCTAQSCEFVRNSVRYSSINGVVGTALLNLKGAARVSIVAGAADLNVHRGGTIQGDIVLQGDLTVSGEISSPGGGPAEGPPGPQGEVGEQGPAGPQGPQGQAGPQGEEGSQGPQGLQGPTGTQGIQGEPGADGPAGPAGPEGEMGPPGKTAQIIGSFQNKAITDLPPDGYIPKDWDSPGNPPLGNQMANGQGMLYSPTQEVCLWVGPTLTPSGWVVLGDVAGPSGPPGPAGPAGVQGLQGIQGVPGSDAAPGPMGPAGAAGPQGPQGELGPQGSQGAAGAQGPPGTAGAPGTPGVSGAQGAQGPKGDTGAQGPAGPNAVSANAGNQAKLGTDNLIFVPVPTGTGVKGVIDGSEAGAGNIGEVVSSSVVGALPLTTLVARNVTQITLTPGDWNIGGVVIFAPTSTGPNAVIAALSQTAAALPSDTEVAQGAGIMQQIWASSMPSGKTQTTPTSLIRINTATSKTIYLVAMASFGGGAVNVTGYLSARRVR